MPVKYAMRDAFGVRDLVEDTKFTIRGKNYGIANNGISKQMRLS
jgi:hypothetical protein